MCGSGSCSLALIAEVVSGVQQVNLSVQHKGRDVALPETVIVSLGNLNSPLRS